MMVIRTAYLNKIKPYLSVPVIKILTGMRRVGKSTILSQLKEFCISDGVPEENIVVINLERIEYDYLRDYKELHAEISIRLTGKIGRKVILLDEIQEVTGWERAVQSFLAEDLGDIIITGSNAHMLSSELATYLTGRYIEIPILSLSFKEFVEFRQANGSVSDSRAHFAEFIQFGGLPGIHALPIKAELISPFITSIIDAILLHDVVKRNSVRDVALIEKLLHYTISNVGNILSVKKIVEYLKSQHIGVGNDTIANYLQYLGNAQIINKVRRFDLQGKRHLEFLDKYFLGDTGLYFAFFGSNQGMIPGILENIVYLELIRRGYAVSVGAFSGKEIDFVAEKQGERLYCQVAVYIFEPATYAREFGNLLAIKDNYPKIVLSLDDLPMGSEQGVRWCNLREWLLEN